MVETDAPYMGFRRGPKGRWESSEPADTTGVAKKLAETMGHDYEDVCTMTTRTALNFFRLAIDEEEMRQEHISRQL